jgi:hypothetical protein
MAKLGFQFYGVTEEETRFSDLLGAFDQNDFLTMSVQKCGRDWTIRAKLANP